MSMCAGHVTMSMTMCCWSRNNEYDNVASHVTMSMTMCCWLRNYEYNNVLLVM